jgi:hypothetical protein
MSITTTPPMTQLKIAEGPAPCAAASLANNQPDPIIAPSEAIVKSRRDNSFLRPLLINGLPPNSLAELL